jgi:peptide chain release factor subunit 1
MEILNTQEQMNDLQKIKGVHTELISVFIPPRKNIEKIKKHLKNELSQASNIKDKRNRKKVQENLLRILS